MKTNRDLALELKRRLKDELRATHEAITALDRYIDNLGETPKSSISLLTLNNLKINTVEQKKSVEQLTIAEAVRNYFDERQDDKINVKQVENHISGLISDKKLYSKTTPVRAVYTVLRALSKNGFLTKNKRGGKTLYSRNEKYELWTKVK